MKCQGGSQANDEENEKLKKQIKQQNKEIEDLKNQIEKITRTILELEKGQTSDMALGRIQLLPAKIIEAAKKVCSGFEEEEQTITPEKIEAISQSLTKLITKQSNSLQKQGIDCEQILSEIPEESANAVSKIAKQFKTTLILNEKLQDFIDKKEKSLKDERDEVVNLKKIIEQMKLQSGQDQQLQQLLNDLNQKIKELQQQNNILQEQIDLCPPIHEKADKYDSINIEFIEQKEIINQLNIQTKLCPPIHDKAKQYELLLKQYEIVQKQLEAQSQIESIDTDRQSVAQSVQDQTDLEDEVTDLEDIDAANFEEEYEKMKQVALADNDLLKAIAKNSNEKPMSTINVWKFFENLMEKKYEQDTKDIQAKIQPRSMTQFMLEHLIQSFGVKSIANKNLASLLNALVKLNAENNTYGVIFCRLLQVYNPNPIDKVLATFLGKARIQFNNLIEVYLKEKKAREAGQKGKKPQTTWGQDQMEWISVGGNAPLIDLFELISQYFEQDKETGSNVMLRLLPNEETKVDFSLLVLTHKIQKTGKSPTEVYQMIDKQNKGELKINEFINGLQTTLDMWLNEEECINISNELDADNTGDISLNEFINKINQLQQRYKNKDAWLCSKAQFLTAISDEYDAKIIRDFHNLKAKFNQVDEDGNGTLELSEFQNLCKMIQPNIKEQRINEIFKYALSVTKGQQPGVITPEAFAVAAQKYNLGSSGKGIFNASKILQGVEREEESVALTKGKVQTTKKPTSRAALQKKK